MFNPDEKVYLLEQFLLGEMYEAGQLGEFPDKLTGARLDPEGIDYKLTTSFKLQWNDDKILQITPNA